MAHCSVGQAGLGNMMQRGGESGDFVGGAKGLVNSE
jgi:hypothetical protein